jgi:hypothetical protein
MAQYHFYIDEKVTVWNRRKYRVTARSKAKAVEIMKQEFNDPKYELDHDSEILWDTESVVNIEYESRFLSERHPRRCGRK